jgi:hypothetical protein
MANDAPAIVVNPSSAATSPTSRKIAAPLSISLSPFQGNDLAYLRAEVNRMPQKSNDPGSEPRTSIPQDQDDELEMADDDDDFEDDEDFDSDSELEDEDVEE